MNSTISTGLIGIEVGLLRGLEAMRWALESLQRFSDITAVSTVVQCQTLKDRSYLKAVVKVTLTISSEQVIQELLSMEYEYERQIQVVESIRCFLLTYDQQVSIAPGVILPHPQLIDHPSWLYCSWEVWRNYKHPILEISLEKIIHQKDMTKMEFYSQGKSITTKVT